MPEFCLKNLKYTGELSMAFITVILLASSCLLYDSAANGMEPTHQKPTLVIPENLPKEDYVHLINSHIIIRDPSFPLEDYYTSNGDNNLHTIHGSKNRQDLQALIRKNFTKDENGEYKIQEFINIDDLISKLRRFNIIFHYDNELKILLYLAMIEEDHFEYMLKKMAKTGPLKEVFRPNATSVVNEKNPKDSKNNIFSSLNCREYRPLALAILSEYAKGDYKTHRITCPNLRNRSVFEQCASIYLNLIQLIDIKDKDLHADVYNINLFCHCAQNYNFEMFIKNNNIFPKNPGIQKNLINNIFSDSVKTVLESLLLCCDDGLFYDTFFIIIIEEIKNIDFKLVSGLVNQLYNSHPEKEKAPLSLKIAYVDTVLMMKKNFELGAKLMESVFKSNQASSSYLKTSYNYNIYAICLNGIKKYEEARNLFEIAFDLEQHSDLEWNLAQTNILSGNFDDINIERIKKFINQDSIKILLENKKYIEGDKPV